MIDILKVQRVVQNETGSVEIRFNAILGNEVIYHKIKVPDFTISGSTVQDIKDIVEQNLDTGSLEQIYEERLLEKSSMYKPDGSSLSTEVRFEEWSPSGSYSPNDVVKYNSIKYKCIQAHTVTDPSWTPEATAALWSSILVFKDRFDDWQQPQGAHDAYPENSIIKHNGLYYKSLVPDNVWEPGTNNMLWVEVDPDTENEIGTVDEVVQGDPWVVDIYYSVDDRVTYNSKEYNVLQAHLSQVGWEPDITPSLFEEIPDNLWSEGTSYISGDVVIYEGTEYICIQDHTADVNDTPDVSPTLWEVYTGTPEWDSNSVSYSIGDRVMYNEQEYECIQAHTSQEGWNPEDAPSLWSVV